MWEWKGAGRAPRLAEVGTACGAARRDRRRSVAGADAEFERDELGTGDRLLIDIDDVAVLASRRDPNSFCKVRHMLMVLDQVEGELAPVDDVTRREFVLAVAAIGLLAACGGDDGADAGSTTAATRTITTPLGTYEIPTSPRRVVAIDNRLDLEPALALELPVIAYSMDAVNPWVPVGSDAIQISSPVNVEQVAGLEPDLIVCVNTRDEYWLAPGLEEIAPIIPTDFEVDWRTNIEQLARWLGRTARLDDLLAAYDEAVHTVRARHGRIIAERSVAVVQYDDSWGFAMQHSMQYLQPQVIADLGGRLLDPGSGVADDGSFSTENIDVLDDADLIMFVGSVDGQLPPGLADNPLWQRVPAVAAGRLLVTEGNTNYGSVYTATQLISDLERLYARAS